MTSEKEISSDDMEEASTVLRAIAGEPDMSEVFDLIEVRNRIQEETGVHVTMREALRTAIRRWVS